MTEMTSEQRREIIEALQTDRKIEAIKLYRNVTGSDLLGANTFIESLQQTLTTGEIREGDGSSLSDEQRQKIVQQLQAGNKIAAVKLLRDTTGTNLRQAKDVVEAIGREQGIEPGMKSGCSAAMLALLAVAFVIATT